VKRPPSEPTDDWQQLQLLAPFPEQRAYELLRPVVLFGRSAAERADETGTAERTLYRRAARFDAEGMASLFPPPQAEKHRRIPARVRAAIRDLHAEHPTCYASAIAAICAIRFDHRPSPHTVRRILAEDPPPARIARRFPPYRAIADPAAARLAIIRLHSEGWAVKRIAASRDCSRQQVYRTLRRWIAEGMARPIICGALSIRTAPCSRSWCDRAGIPPQRRSASVGCSRAGTMCPTSSSRTRSPATVLPGGRCCPVSSTGSTSGAISAPSMRTSPPASASGGCAGFRSPGHAQRCRAAYGPIMNRFRPRRHVLAAAAYRDARDQRFATWRAIVGLPAAV